jgi:hypothetical protein
MVDLFHNQLTYLPDSCLQPPALIWRDFILGDTHSFKLRDNKHGFSLIVAPGGLLPLNLGDQHRKSMDGDFQPSEPFLPLEKSPDGY